MAALGKALRWAAGCRAQFFPPYPGQGPRLARAETWVENMLGAHRCGIRKGAAPSVKPWSATPGANTPCNAVSNQPDSSCNIILLWMEQAAGYRTPRFLTFKQALELGGNMRRGERGTKVFFVKQLQVRDQDAVESVCARLIPMMGAL